MNLLLPSPAAGAAAYHVQVVQALGAAVEVKDAGSGRGKGIFATQSFSPGDVIFKERALVSQQDRDSCQQLLACAHCHKFVGSVEAQIARLLSFVAAKGRQLQQKRLQQDCNAAGGSSSVQAAAAGSSSMQAAAASSSYPQDTNNTEDSDEDEDDEEWQHRYQLFEAFAGEELLNQLASGHTHLPLSQQVPLPQPVYCRYGCGQCYCSKSCAEGAWQHSHCLLCPGQQRSGSHYNGHAADSSATSDTQLSGSGASSQDAMPPAAVYGMAIRRDLLPSFFQHAAETNDIFRLAAQLLASVALQAARTLHEDPSVQAVEGLCRAVQGICSTGTAASDAPPVQTPESQAAQPSPDTEPSTHTESSTHTRRSTESQPQPVQSPAAAALAAAWFPYSAGWKKAWWECVAVPDDVEDELEFRQQLRDLACESLTLLRAALPGVDSSWPELLQPDVWGNVIGMFELNNLGLAVPSPVEDYFLMVDELPEPERSAAKQQGAQQWLDVLDKWYDTPVEGTGFYALQSCANHSCAPNAATEGEGDGRVSVYALKAIKPGEEITISYLDEPEDEPWSYKQRQAALRDYGFVCACTRCEAEKSRRRRPGIKLGRR